MNEKHLAQLLGRVARGELPPEDAAREISLAPFSTEMGDGVNLDTSRACRTGMAEAVFGASKSVSQLVRAVGGLAQAGQPVIATRLSREQGKRLAKEFPEGTYFEIPSLFVLGREVELREPWPESGRAMVVAAGSSDLPVALEALGTCLFLGLSCGLAVEVGVAGLHRLMPKAGALGRAEVHIVVAGMEGALPSVVAGMFGRPVIGVPTSVGYGTGLGGLAALMSMLNSCAPGVAAVNIDNGFGAAVMAAKVLGIPGRGEAGSR